MRNIVVTSLLAALTAGATLSTVGIAAAGTASAGVASAGNASPGTASAVALFPQVMGRTIYSDTLGGYADSGRRFRFAATTLTVPAQTLPSAAQDTAFVSLVHRGTSPGPFAQIHVDPGGGVGSVVYETAGSHGTLAVSPRVGDRLRVSVYYDRHGHVYFTATDKTRGVTRTVRKSVARDIARKPYNSVGLFVDLSGQPRTPADRLLWRYASTKVTTYLGVRGTVTGPWTTRKIVDTTTGTSSGQVVMSPSRLRNGGADFGVWLRHR